MLDFSVSATDGEILLKGHLRDTTDFKHFHSILRENRCVNFSKIYSVSWLGLQRLLEFFKSSNIIIKAKNIPADVYAMCIVFPEFSENVQVESFEIDVLVNESLCKKELHDMSNLKMRAEGGHLFLGFPNGSYALGLASHVFGDPSIDLRTLEEKSHQNLTEHHFWFSYISFTGFVNDMCANSIKSTSIVVEETLQAITRLVASSEAALKEIQPHSGESRARSLLGLLTSVQKATKQVTDGLMESRVPYLSLKKKYQTILLNQRIDPSRVLFDILKEFSEIGTTQRSLAKVLDFMGAQLVNKVISFGEMAGIVEIFQQIDKNSLPQNKVELAGRMLFPTDSRENYEWSDIIGKVEADYQNVVASLEKCTIALQGYDLIRQVLEHRVSEAEMLHENLSSYSSGMQSFDAIREKMLEMTCSKQVTDQEKLSFKFYFPNESGSCSDCLESGDINFF
jgi:hypothetical protein